MKGRVSGGRVGLASFCETAHGMDMSYFLFRCAMILAGGLLTAEAAVTITIAPDDLGGMTFAFRQTAANPTISVETVMTTGVRMELPPGMFSQAVFGGPAYTDISGGFNVLAQFRDLNSRASYDIVQLNISNVLSYASFEFRQPFGVRGGQTQVQFDLFSNTPGALNVSPDALVAGTHSISSVLFGTVTVNVIPEPVSLGLLLLGLVSLTKRRR